MQRDSRCEARLPQRVDLALQSELARSGLRLLHRRAGLLQNKCANCQGGFTLLSQCTLRLRCGSDVRRGSSSGNAQPSNEVHGTHRSGGHAGELRVKGGDQVADIGQRSLGRGVTVEEAHARPAQAVRRATPSKEQIRRLWGSCQAVLWKLAREVIGCSGLPPDGEEVHAGKYLRARLSLAM